MENELISIEGTINAVVYQNEESGFTVLRVLAGESGIITIVGSMAVCAPGEQLTATGKWIRHPSYGEQFKAEWIERSMPKGEAAIIDFLSSGVIKGVGLVTAKRIVEKYGTDTLGIIEDDWAKLTEIKGITAAKARQIRDSFLRQLGLRRLMEYLLKNELPPQLAMKLYRCYGEEALNALRNNPYIISGDYFGVDFHTTDDFALKLGLADNAPERAEAGLLYELRYNLTLGHTFLPSDKLFDATATLLSIDKEILEDAFIALEEEGKIESEEIAGVDACYLAEMHEAESYVAARISLMADAELSEGLDIEGLIDEISAQQGITYAPLQRFAVEAASKGQIVVLTGGPGTGKTTSVKGILALFEKLGLETALAAPTGRAAKRMTELCGREAMTIHRLLEVEFSPQTGEMVFFHDEEEPLKAEAVVVDECSMLDITLMRALLAAMKPDSRLILVGDVDQLPPVGPGSPFSDIIRSGVVETVRLTEIFRQAENSLIVVNAHAVNRGEQPDLVQKNKDFFFLKRCEPSQAVDTIVELCSKRLPDNMGIDPWQIQVLSPTRKNEAGTQNLNLRLQDALNPAAPNKNEKRFGDYVFRQDDRVMQIKNNYDIMWTKGNSMGCGIFNGDIGRIGEIDLTAETMTICFDDEKLVEYPFENLNELEPAYAMTVHKSQGSEYRAVILSASRSSPYLLTRGVLYTAITRARELLIIVGDDQIVKYMTENNKQKKRYSGLRVRIRRR